MTEFDRWWLDTLGPLANADAAYAHAKMAWEAAILAEREACARVCDSMSTAADEDDGDFGSGFVNAAKHCAAAIRAR